jgi:hypothetical protein
LRLAACVWRWPAGKALLNLHRLHHNRTETLHEINQEEME